MCSGVKRNDDDERIKGDLFWFCYGFGNYLKPLMSMIALSHKNLVAISFCSFGKKRVKGNCLRKFIEEIANIAKITNSTRIKSCSKNCWQIFV